MNSEELYEKIKQINIENFIWIIYVAIIIISWYANTLEKKYFIFNDINSKNKYRKIMIIIFIILTIIYLYFLKSSYQDLIKIKLTDSYKKKKLTYISFIGSLLIFISGIIFLYIAINDEEIDVEIAFN